MAREALLDTGVVSSPVGLGGNTLTDSAKNWAAHVHKNRLVKIVSDSGVGQLAVIGDNSSNTLLIKGSWPQAISAGATYMILEMDLMQMLRDVFGGGFDISVAHPLETHDPTIEDVEAKLDLVIVPDTFVYLDAGGEQTIFAFTPAQNTKLDTIWFDLATLAQNTTIRLKHQIDGATYRTFETFNWTTGMDPGVYFRNVALASGRPLQATMQEAANEGADRNIPYYYAYEPR